MVNEHYLLSFFAITQVAVVILMTFLIECSEKNVGEITEFFQIILFIYQSKR
jgi:hypothetical protein